MNDCFWKIIDACGDEECSGTRCCYVCCDSDLGRKLLDRYQIELSQCLCPLKEKWKMHRWVFEEAMSVEDKQD